MNPFPYSDDNKRYHTWNYHLRHTFGIKVCKVALNGGFTCPNRDGTKGVGGCSYCSDQGSGDFAGDPLESMEIQFQKGKTLLTQKWPEALHLPYIQANSGTYAPVEELRSKFEPLLVLPGTVGLCIATRADCLPENVLDYLVELNRRTYLIVELGLQSIHEETARKINRGHSYQEFLQGYEALSDRGIRVCIHLINGLPGETRQMMLESAKEVARLKPHSVKLHLLHVLKNTPLGTEYLASPFPLLTREEYVGIICDQLELFPPEIVIQRLTGDGAGPALLGPMWSKRKREVLNEIDKELLRRNSMQGSKAQ